MLPERSFSVDPAPSSKLYAATKPEVVGGAVTVIDAEDDLVGSAALVAVSLYVPGVVGAVYKPEVVMVPPVPDQDTAVFVVPETDAVNCWLCPVRSDADEGVTDTDITVGAVTVIDAEADLLGSAALVAVTVYMPGVEGAVYRPAVVIDPPVPDQVTAVFDVPVTVVENC